MQREYKHPERSFQCSECNHYIISFEVSMAEAAVFAYDEWCNVCQKITEFEAIFSPTYITAGMYTKRYNGQEAAVKGWGTYNLDYGRAGSDLVSGRATEATKANPGRVRE